MICKKCGKEIDKKAVICPECGCKVKKPIFKKWWFWVLVVIVVIAVSTSGGNNSVPQNDNSTAETTKTEQLNYEVVDLQTMFDELDSNAMKAESNYSDKLIEFECKIASFDSDGQYITVEPVLADEWNFRTAMCNIKNKEHKDYLIEKNVDDVITIKGKVTSIGEVIGYSIDINEVK